MSYQETVVQPVLRLPGPAASSPAPPTPQGPTANMGEGSGIATIEGDTATFKPDGAEDECKITMKFTGGRLVVTQEGICGFGHNVTADGTYRRVSSR